MRKWRMEVGAMVSHAQSELAYHMRVLRGDPSTEPRLERRSHLQPKR